jgi:hypothetical protein
MKPKPKYFAVKDKPANPPQTWHIAETTDGKEIPLGHSLYIDYEEYEKIREELVWYKGIVESGLGVAKDMSIDEVKELYPKV